VIAHIFSVAYATAKLNRQRALHTMECDFAANADFAAIAGCARRAVDLLKKYDGTPLAFYCSQASALITGTAAAARDPGATVTERCVAAAEIHLGLLRLAMLGEHPSPHMSHGDVVRYRDEILPGIIAAAEAVRRLFPAWAPPP